MTEVDHYSDATATPPKQPRRVTYDDLVLQQETSIRHAHWVEWISPHSIQQN